MRSPLPKVLHPVCGLPMVEWTVRAARAAGAAKVIVVQGPGRELDELMPDGVELAVQAEQDGTAGALEAAVHLLEGCSSVVVLAGDVPLVDAETVRSIFDAHSSANAAATIATMVVDDPSGYGRIVKSADGRFERVVETKNPGDATAEELLIDEVNTGLVAFRCEGLAELLLGVGAANAQGERYLPDAIASLASTGKIVETVLVSDPALTLGVNDKADLEQV
jgi:bifunctional UDP-N-acetylglucosamine pyrophosphorylase/glucosamine-1-phosphate N-acetyltransferase